jgi:hypothetical protein
VAAQGRVPSIQGVDRIHFAGAWTRFGFHEDGLLSGVRVAEALGAVVPWGGELDAERTAVLPGARVPMLGQVRKILPTEMPRIAVPDVLGRVAASASIEPDRGLQHS